MLHAQLPLALGCQRWRDRRDRYRPAGEVIEPSEYEVASAREERLARAFVERHHYSGRWVAARFTYELYRRDRLVGAAVFSHPVHDRVLTSVFPGEPIESVELGRFVLLDEVPGNGETWFLARAFELLRREHLLGVVSFSDPVPRTTASGVVIFPGHLGTIYKAHNAVYIGRGTARTLRLLPDGRVFSERAIQKIRAQERGWHGAARLLQQFGAPPPGPDISTWLREQLASLTRPLRHRGNHKYAWTLDRRSRALRRHLAALRQPYPSHLDVA